jgi:hypothetical protein
MRAIAMLLLVGCSSSAAVPLFEIAPDAGADVATSDAGREKADVAQEAAIDAGYDARREAAIEASPVEAEAPEAAPVEAATSGADASCTPSAEVNEGTCEPCTRVGGAGCGSMGEYWQCPAGYVPAALSCYHDTIAPGWTCCNLGSLPCAVCEP